jgi:hypothetical protein
LDAKNAKISIIKVNNATPVSPVVVDLLAPVAVEIDLTLPQLIDSVRYSIVSALPNIDTVYVARSPWAATTFTQTITFHSVGIKKLIVSSFSKEFQSFDTLLFDVRLKKVNFRPVWNDDTLELVAKKGIATNYNLKNYSSDPNNDSLTYTFFQTTNLTLFSIKDSIVSQLITTDTGSYYLSVMVSDGELSDTATIRWRIFIQTANSLIYNDSISMEPNKIVTIDALANDTSTTSFFVLSSVSNGKLGKATIQNNKINYEPFADVWGKDTLKYVLNGADTGLVFITINPLVIKITDDTISVKANVGDTIRVLANDIISSGKLILSSVTNGNLGKAYIKDSLVVYIPDSNKTGIDTLKYKVNAGKDSGLVIITVAPIEYKINTDLLSVNENEKKPVNVLVNDTISIGTLKVTSVTKGKLGAATFNDSTVTYQPDSGKTGVDTVTYFVNGTTNAGLLIITIKMLDIVVLNDSASVMTNSFRNIYVLENDTISNGKLQITSVTTGKLGTTVIKDNFILYTPNPNVNGSDTFSYTVNNRATGVIMVQIIPISIITKPDSLIIDEDAQAALVNVLSNDSINTGTLTLTSVKNGKKGAAKIENGQVSYTPSLNQFGVDTVEYIVNNVAPGYLYVTIRPVNDKPVFVNADTVLLIDEMDTRVLTFRTMDPDLTHPKIFLSTRLSWVASIDSVDSIKVTFSPKSDVATVTQNPKTQLFIIGAVEGADTVYHTLKIIVRNVNQAPDFVNPDSVIIVNENMPKTIKISAVDPDGGVAMISVVTKPAWVTSVGTVDTIALTFSPGYNVATTTLPTITELLSVRVSDGVDSVIHNIKVRVLNTNRKPSFTKALPGSGTTVAIGDSLKYTFTGSDPDGDAVTYSMQTVNSDMKIDASLGAFVFSVNKEKYFNSQQLSVTIRVTDNTLYSDTTFRITTIPHVWSTRSGTVPTENAPNLFTALGTDTMFTITSSNDGTLKIYRSVNGGAAWEGTPFIIGKAPMHHPRFFYAAGNTVYIGGSYYKSGFMHSFPFNSTLVTNLNSYTPFAMDVSASGRVVAQCYQYIGPNQLYYKDNTINRSDTLDKFRFSQVSAGDKNIWGVADSGVYLMKAYSETAPLLGFTRIYSYGTYKTITCDGNDGDTVYATDTTFSYVYRATSTNTNFTSVNLGSGIVPRGMLMLNGAVGWVWTKSGEVYFTNNAFVTVTKDTPVNASNPVFVTNLIRSSDNKTVYAISKSGTGPIVIYRY